MACPEKHLNLYISGYLTVTIALNLDKGIVQCVSGFRVDTTVKTGNWRKEKTRDISEFAYTSV